MIIRGDCLEKLKALADNSIDSVVTDPPYGLKFMGKKWDYDVPSVEVWREVLRVLKPGGHLLSFGGTRTYHRMACAIEDAGFEIRDQVMWLYGSGFPKSHDISKAIDKAAGAEREVVGKRIRLGDLKAYSDDRSKAYHGNYSNDGNESPITVPATESAKQWQGWGTALKPANEPICLARKPLEKGLTVSENVLKYGTGSINVDAGRIELASSENPEKLKARSGGQEGFKPDGYVGGIGQRRESQGWDCSKGRWPANVLLDECAAEMLDEMSGITKSNIRHPTGGVRGHHHGQERKLKDVTVRGQSDSGGASRFFYVAKASKRERGEGNNHPTVKPIKLMEYLIKLVTPPNGTVLDPFMGSGSTGVAAKKLGFNFIGIELSPEYAEIAEKRISHAV